MADASECKLDELFMNIAGQLGGLNPLLRAFFGFLHRRTDFYVCWDDEVATQLKPSSGFPKGKAESLLLQAFRSYPQKRYSDTPLAKSEESPSVATGARGPPLPAAESDEGGASCSGRPKIKVSYTDKGKQVPVDNGGICQGYYWTQNMAELTVYARVAPGTRGKDICCDIEPRSLQLSIRGQSKPILRGELPFAIKCDDSLWNVDAETVIISLEKVKPNWWSCVVQGEPEIDTQLVDSTRKVSQRIDR
jgi:hypothetical protein